MLRYMEDFICNIAYYTAHNSYTTTELKRYHKVGVGCNCRDNPPPLSWNSLPKSIFFLRAKCLNSFWNSRLTGSFQPFNPKRVKVNETSVINQQVGYRHLGQEEQPTCWLLTFGNKSQYLSHGIAYYTILLLLCSTESILMTAHHFIV